MSIPFLKRAPGGALVRDIAGGWTRIGAGGNNYQIVIACAANYFTASSSPKSFADCAAQAAALLASVTLGNPSLKYLAAGGYGDTGTYYSLGFR